MFKTIILEDAICCKCSHFLFSTMTLRKTIVSLPRLEQDGKHNQQPYPHSGNATPCRQHVQLGSAGVAEG